MKPPGWALCFGIGILAAAAGAGSAAPVTAGSREPLAGAIPFGDDARLEKRVSLAEKNRPLADALADLGQQIQVRLTATADTADDKVSLFLDQRPAAEVMALVARQFDFQWTRRGRSYELSQSAASKRREAALWEKETAPQWEAIAARIRLSARLLMMPRAQWEARQKEISQRLAAPDLAPAERARLTEEQQAITDVMRPFSGVAVTLLSSLTPDQIQQLRSGRDVRFSTLDHSLTPALSELIQQEFAERVKNTPLGSDVQHRQIDAILRLSDFTGPLYSPERASQRALHLEIGLTFGDSNGYAPAGWFPTTPLEKAAPATVTQTDDPALKREVSLLAANPSARAAAPQPPGGWPVGLLTVGDIGEALHRAAGLEVVADSFIRARLDSQGLSTKRPVVQILDKIANGLRYDWHKEGSLILFRSRIYYRDRPAEVPDRILGPWRQQLAAEGGPTLDSLAALAAALNETRARGMHDFWGWYLEGTPAVTAKWADDFYRNRYHLRLWASLSPRQRQAAIAHTMIPVAQMSVPQRQAFLQALTARDEAVWGPMFFPQTLAATELAAGSFSLEVRQFQQQTFRHTFPSGGSVEFTQPVGGAQRAFLGKPGDIGPHPEPVGPATWFDGYTFAYYLANQEAPVMKSPMDLPRLAPAH